MLGRDAHSKFDRFRFSENAMSRFVRTACAVLGPREETSKAVVTVRWNGWHFVRNGTSAANCQVNATIALTVSLKKPRVLSRTCPPSE
ncbi:hypothetical protein ElyMa_004134300 [Elysia marginata]|uniref:Uncharacterized protein n=1 Tax=Elysia marginata TaxID=1093978 RepID=A0AAV4GE88_9GAST|nr:hypothetical protein ElyMa_004134300 [Elysia marginata]